MHFSEFKAVVDSASTYWEKHKGSRLGDDNAHHYIISRKIFYFKYYSPYFYFWISLLKPTPSWDSSSTSSFCPLSMRPALFLRMHSMNWASLKWRGFDILSGSRFCLNIGKCCTISLSLLACLVIRADVCLQHCDATESEGHGDGVESWL